MPRPPSERRGEQLPVDHPFWRDVGRVDTRGDCISEVPAEDLEALAAYHDHAEPPDSQPDPEELV